jgi:hypothetical protein
VEILVMVADYGGNINYTAPPKPRRLANGGFLGGDGRYYTLGGKGYDNEQAYTIGSIQERNQSPGMYDNASQYGLLNSDSNSSGDSGGSNSDDKMFSFLDRAADKQFGYQKGLMGLTNEYRTKEGATQGQMDEQAHRRLTTQVSSQQFMQRQGSDLAEKAKQNDSGRAIRAFKGNF